MGAVGKDGSGDRGRLLGFGFDTARGLLGELESLEWLVSGRRSGRYPLVVVVTVVFELIITGNAIRGSVRVIESWERVKVVLGDEYETTEVVDEFKMVERSRSLNQTHVLRGVACHPNSPSYFSR